MSEKEAAAFESSAKTGKFPDTGKSKHKVLTTKQDAIKFKHKKQSTNPVVLRVEVPKGTVNDLKSNLPTRHTPDGNNAEKAKKSFQGEIKKSDKVRFHLTEDELKRIEVKGVKRIEVDPNRP